LWQRLHTEKRKQRLNVSRSEFEEAGVIYGDINDYIERIWSRERYDEAISAFEGAVVIHDIATRNSVVHTDYCLLESRTVLDKERTLLTHSPDRITSEWPLSKADKTFLVQGGSFAEVVEDDPFPMDAAVYHKQEGKYYVGYRNPKGKTTVYEKDGVLNLGGVWDRGGGTALYKVDLYEDVGGKYLPKLEEDEDCQYVERKDGKVEKVTFDAKGSRGTVVEDLRAWLVNR
jgi:hypothetical protein